MHAMIRNFAHKSVHWLNTHKTLLLYLAVLILIVSRFVLLERSARFIWDESDDLLRMKEIYDTRRITLVGPIAGNNINIYGSLSYYMLMPFTVLAKFDPIGPVLGTAFYSVITILLFAYVLSKKYAWKGYAAILFLTILFPYLQAGRWAWNPHYIPFWQVLSIFIISMYGAKRSWYVWVSAGLFMGLSIHNHWYAFFATAGWIGALAWLKYREKRLMDVAYFIMGTVLAVIPFLVFDLLRPPGLFITRFIYFSPLTSEASTFVLREFLQKVVFLPYQMIFYFFQKIIPTMVFIILLSHYIFVIIRKPFQYKKILLIPIAFQLIGLSLISGSVFDHYFLGAVISIILFIAIPDEGKRFSRAQLIVLCSLVIFSIPASIQEVFKNDWSTNIARTRTITDIMQSNLNGQSCNVVAIASTDSGTTGKRYRDMLELRGIKILNKEQYTDYDCLFVVSQSDLKTIQQDKAYEMDRIRGSRPVNVWDIEGDWKLYKFVTVEAERAK